MQNIDVVKSYIFGMDQDSFIRVENDQDYARVCEVYYGLIECKMAIEKIAMANYGETLASWDKMARELGAV